MTRGSCLLVLGLSLAACDGKTSSPTRLSPSPQIQSTGSQTLQSVTLSVNPAALKARGDTAQAIPTGIFSDGTSQNVMATCRDWRSDNLAVLTIGSGGLVTAQGNGSATITTTCQVVADHPPQETVPVFARLLVTLTL